MTLHKTFSLTIDDHNRFVFIYKKYKFLTEFITEIRSSIILVKLANATQFVITDV